MNYREKVAHHEAAHVVVSARYGGGPMLHGIDINAASSVAGAFGNAGVGTLVHDDTLSLDQQQVDLMRNLIIICAGAGADARTNATDIRGAFGKQPGDHSAAVAAIVQSPLTTDPGQEEIDFLLGIALDRTEEVLAEPHVWDMVERIAAACLSNDGRLSKAQIEEILQDKVIVSRSGDDAGQEASY